jgi:uncharacterized protein (DUF433 family)
MISLSAYTLPTASHLSGISESRLRQWDKNGFFVPSFAAPDRRRHYSRIYSFRDIVALRAIQELLDRGVPIRRAKEFADVLRSLPEDAWPQQRFYVAAGDAFFSYQDAVVAAGPLGQPGTGDIVEVDLRSVVDDVVDRVGQLSKRSDDEIGRITSDRYIMNGVPILAGTRTPTAVVYELYRDGYSVEQIRKEFPRLTPDDIRAAIEFHEAERLPKAG